MGASVIQLIPKSELAPGQAAAVRNEIIGQVLQRAANELKMTIDKLVVRDIRPKSDLDYTYEDWRETTGATADAYETMSTGTLADQRWIVIFGVKDDVDNRSCTAIKINVGGADMAIWTLQQLGEEDNMVGISPGGVVIPPNAPYTISRFVRSASSTSNLVLKGVVIEPRGKVVSP